MKADRYILSIKQLLLSMIFITFSVSYLCHQICERDNKLGQSILLQTILLFLDQGIRSHAHEQATEKALPEIYHNALVQEIKYTNKILNEAAEQIKNPGQDAKLKISTEKLFKDKIIPRAVLTAPLMFRFEPRLSCQAIIYQGPIDDNYAFVLSSLIGYAEHTPLKNIYLINFSFRCMAHQLGLTNLLFIHLNDPKKTWLVGIPQTLLPYLGTDNLTLKLASNDIKIDKQKLQIDGTVNPYIEIENNYTAFPIDYIESLVFKEASEHTMHFRAPNDLQGAIDDISAVSSSNASLGEISTTSTFFVSIMPIVMLALIYLLYARTQFLLRHRHSTEEPWMFKDQITEFDFVVSYISAFAPIFCAGITNLAFALANNVGLYIFGHRYILSWRKLFGIPEYSAKFLYLSSMDIYASAVFVFFCFSAFYSIRTTINLLRLIKLYRKNPPPLR